MPDAYFGTAGWSFADWNGIFYPARAPKKPLAWYSDFFDCAEVNMTFYRPPEARTCAGWVKAVEGKRFRFAVKLSQEFTHPAGARTEGSAAAEMWGAREARAFLAGIAPIEQAGRLGPLLAQFPWSFRNTPEHRDRVARLAEWFAGREVAVEVRHASWDREEVREWLRGLGLAWVNVDQPALRDCIPPAEHVTAPAGYVRLHGRNAAKWFARDIEPHERYDYLYPEKELEPWVERIRRLMAAAKALYVIGNNHYRGKAPANTLQLKSKVLGKKVAVPEGLLKEYPQLQAIAGERQLGIFNFESGGDG